MLCRYTLTLVLAVLAAHLSSAKYEYEFQNGDKIFTIVANRQETQSRAELVCRRKYHASLARVMDTRTVRVINTELVLLKQNLTGSAAKIHELWIWGKINTGQGSQIDISTQKPQGQGKYIYPQPSSRLPPHQYLIIELCQWWISLRY